MESSHNGALLEGGLSTGKTTTDTCDLTPDSPQTLWCHAETPFLTQVKLLGAYPLPYGVQVSAAFQSIPGPEIRATSVFFGDQIEPSLGRPPTGFAFISVVEPGTVYGERLNQLDLRLSKLINFGGGAGRPFVAADASAVASGWLAGDIGSGAGNLGPASGACRRPKRYPAPHWSIVAEPAADPHNRYCAD